MRRRRTNRRSGFTLLEVMLVLGILAMLALFVVPKFMDTGQAAKKDAAKALVGPSSSLGTALALYYQRLNDYPEELVDLVERPDDLEEDDDRWYRFYEEASFIDPWKNELVYKKEGEINEDGYDLYSMGPNGDDDDGGDDDIGNFRKE